MKTIIAGCRNFYDGAVLAAAIAESGFLITEVVSGGADGVDRLGEEWALTNGKPLQIFRADWKKFGNSAGPRRNTLMADYAEALIALWDGESKGTRNMIDQAATRGLLVYVHPITI